MPLCSRWMRRPSSPLRPISPLLLLAPAQVQVALRADVEGLKLGGALPQKGARKEPRAQAGGQLRPGGLQEAVELPGRPLLGLAGLPGPGPAPAAGADLSASADSTACASILNIKAFRSQSQLMMTVNLRKKGVESYKAALSAAGAVACGPVLLLLHASGDLSGCATSLLCTHAFLIITSFRSSEAIVD